MNDAEIRALLYPTLQGGVCVDELPVGTTRADVTHLTPDFMHGYELKGDGDTLKRVPMQLKSYMRAFDLVTFVVTPKHSAKLILLLMPYPWVGVAEARPDGINPIWPATAHGQLCKAQMLGLLRQDEVKEFLTLRKYNGLSKYRTWELYGIAKQDDSITAAEVAVFVRQRLIDRMPERLQQRVSMKKKREERKAADARREADNAEWIAKYTLTT